MASLIALKAAMNFWYRLARAAAKRADTDLAAERVVSNSLSIECNRPCTSSYCVIAFIFGAIPSICLPTSAIWLVRSPSMRATTRRSASAVRASSSIDSKLMRIRSSAPSSALAAALLPPASSVPSSPPSKVPVPTSPSLGLNSSDTISSAALIGALLLAASSPPPVLPERLRLGFLAAALLAADDPAPRCEGSSASKAIVGISTSSRRARWKMRKRWLRCCSRSLSI
mmetsp:Transcript_81461/g.162037  ORF Transcript_81461/g.162037 Transcript_81461/m.162037 type:complete len:228 (-) Transcript_81461:2072-2755(-)